jgi:hypothetical protein
VAPDELRAVLAGLPSHGTSIKVIGNPFAPVLLLPRGFERSRDMTQVVKLQQGYAAVSSRFSKGHRSAVTKAARSGVTVRLATSLDDYRAYYDMYRASVRRWGSAATSNHSWSLFMTGHQVGQRDPDAVRLWLAEVQGQLAAGAWTFTWNGHTAYWHAAAYEEHFNLRPANLIVATIAQQACIERQQFLDLGCSGGHVGPAEFKRRFGAEDVAIPSFHYQSRTVAALLAVRRGVRVANLRARLRP